MKNITYLDNDTLPECVYKNKQNILAIIDEIAKTYGLDFKGEYNSEWTYSKNNVVVYKNKTYVYISIATSSNILPTNTQFWALWIDPKPGEPGAKGEPGEKGADGGEVQSVVKVSTVENVDTYRMTFSNGSTSDFTVTNGKDGQNGQNGENGKGIENISLVSSTESSSTYRISYGDGLTFDFTVQNGVSPTITIGTVTTVASTENARVENSGSEKNVVLDFYLPKGEKGDTGVTVNGEIVSEQTADSNTKAYSTAFVNNFIIQQFASTINGMQADIDKKLELTETSEFITGALSINSKELNFNIVPNSGVYALYYNYNILCIFSTYVDTSLINRNIKIINQPLIDYEVNTSELTKLRNYVVSGILNLDDNILSVSCNGAVLDVSTGQWTTSSKALANTTFKLVKLS